MLPLQGLAMTLRERNCLQGKGRHPARRSTQTHTCQDATDREDLHAELSPIHGAMEFGYWPNANVQIVLNIRMTHIYHL